MVFSAIVAATMLVQDVTPAIDPGAVAQGNDIRGTMQGHADRDRARKQGQRAASALSEACRKAWLRRDAMSRAERQRLYDTCPR